MAGMSNYSQHPCGPQWLMYSMALGGGSCQGEDTLSATLVTDHARWLKIQDS